MNFLLQDKKCQRLQNQQKGILLQKNDVAAISKKTLKSYKTFVNHKKCHITWTCDDCEQTTPHISRSIHMKSCKKESTTISFGKCPFISDDKSNLNRHI